MRLNQRSITPRSSNPHVAKFLSQNPTLSPNQTKPLSSLPQTKKTERFFAWQVAPNLFLSFKYAWAGVRYAFVTQRNFRIHTVIGSVAVTLGLLLQIPRGEMAIVGLTCALVLVLELLNTAIESVVDLTVKQTYHELAKIAKDCAAGAVLISALAAMLVAGLILLPRLFMLISSFQ